MFLEDQMMFKEAEEKFLKASKPREAVLMCVLLCFIDRHFLEYGWD